MHVILKIEADGSDPADIYDETNMFSRLAETQPDISVSRVEEATPLPGQKGAEIEIGTMMVALITSGAVTALINVLKVYFDRDKSVSVEIENPDGRKIKFSANNMKPERLQETLASLKTVVGDAS